MDEPLKKRRQLLQAAGAGSAALLAGCSGLLGSSDDESGDDGETESDDGQNSDDGTNGDGTSAGGMDSQDGDSMQSGDTREVGMIAQPDQAAMTEIRQQLRAGELNRSEAVEQQRELVAQSVEELASAIESETDIEIVEQLSELGAIRADGAPVELIDMLPNEQMTAIVSREQLDQEQQSQSGSNG
jgi:hypothetical protein